MCEVENTGADTLNEELPVCEVENTGNIMSNVTGEGFQFPTSSGGDTASVGGDTQIILQTTPGKSNEAGEVYDVSSATVEGVTETDSLMIEEEATGKLDAADLVPPFIGVSIHDADATEHLGIAPLCFGVDAADLPRKEEKSDGESGFWEEGTPPEEGTPLEEDPEDVLASEVGSDALEGVNTLDDESMDEAGEGGLEEGDPPAEPDNISDGETGEPMEGELEEGVQEGLGLAELHKQLVRAKRRAAYFQSQANPFPSEPLIYNIQTFQRLCSVSSYRR
jgi:hypothetical protein